MLGEGDLGLSRYAPLYSHCISLLLLPILLVFPLSS
jgi:hypothetical protein